MTCLLEAISLSKAFDTPVLKDLCLSVNEGESIAIMGASGEGKSTLLHILGALDSPDSGEIYFRKTPFSKLIPHKLRRESFGFLFQSFYLFEEDSALQNVLLPAKLKREATHKRSLAYKRALQLLEDVGLSSKVNALAKTLSGGERQRVALARALCNDPDILFADEPTGNLDHKNSEKIHELLLNRVKAYKKTLIVVTHDPHLAALCDRTLYLEQGKLVSKVAANS